MASRTGRKAKKSEGKLGIIGICAVVIAFGGIMYSKTKDAREEVTDLTRQQEKLEAQLEDEQSRSKQLEEKKIYVQTKKYVEEVAKSLGLVYPDEIIYRPEQN